MATKIVDSRAQIATIKISIPFKVAMDTKLLQQSIQDLAETIGCTKCFSGVNCIFQMQKDFVINESLKASQVLPALHVRNEVSTFSEVHTVTAQLSGKEMLSIDNILNAAAEIANLRGGCPQCHSGFDFGFQQELETISQRIA